MQRTGRPINARLFRWALALAGVACVGIGAVGVVLPGLPTTIFLIAASWCFTRSCPYLERKLLGLPIFRPFLRYLEPGAVMPRSAVVWTLAIMWTAIAISTATLIAREAPIAAAAILPAAGIAGTWFVVRLRVRRLQQAA